MNTIIVNFQLKIQPNIRLEPNKAIHSQITPSRVPVISWFSEASIDKRLQIAPELFSTRSKYATSCRSKHANAFERIRWTNFDPEIANALY